MTETATAETNDWSDWVGRTARRTDLAALTDLDRMSAILDRDDPPWQAGDPVPAMWHMMYFPAVQRASQLGADGLPERGDALPPIPLPRRMFAGARTTYHRALRAGDALELETRIDSVEEKEGRSGALVFLRVGYAMRDQEGLAIEEERSVVFRGLDAPARTQAKSESGIAAPGWRRTVTPHPVTLFGYSALTYNTHRIHYDRTYTTEEEGYPGLLVHGPLIATHLAELVRDNTDRPIKSFDFRARRPLFDTAPFEVVGAMTEDGAGCQVEALDPEGAVAMAATVEFG